ncbi:MAG: hypothetical protein ACFFA6_03650 [Promethearchaeota archaeon]
MNEDEDQVKLITCCVMNCQVEIPIDKAIRIESRYFCPICGTAYYRSILNL